MNGVNLRVARGTIHALIGPNGAGKTTCFQSLTKFLQPTRGRIAFNGRDITVLPPTEIARLGLVRSFQISAVFPHLTCKENVRIALQRKRGGSFDFWRSKRVLETLDARAMALLSDVGLADYAGLTAVELPYGRKRALELATTIALDPEMLLLDEPTAGMGHEDIDRIGADQKFAATARCWRSNLSARSTPSDRITVLPWMVLAEGDGHGVGNLRCAPIWGPPALDQAPRTAAPVDDLQAWYGESTSCTASVSMCAPARS